MMEDYIDEFDSILDGIPSSGKWSDPDSRSAFWAALNTLVNLGLTGSGAERLLKGCYMATKDNLEKMPDDKRIAEEIVINQ